VKEKKVSLKKSDFSGSYWTNRKKKKWLKKSGLGSYIRSGPVDIRSRGFLVVILGKICELGPILPLACSWDIYEKFQNIP